MLQHCHDGAQAAETTGTVSTHATPGTPAGKFTWKHYRSLLHFRGPLCCRAEQAAVLPDQRWRTCMRPAQLMMLEHACRLRCGANQMHGFIHESMLSNVAQRTRSAAKELLRHAATHLSSVHGPPSGGILSHTVSASQLTLALHPASLSCVESIIYPRLRRCTLQGRPRAPNNDHGAGSWAAADGAPAHKLETQPLRTAARLA